MSRNNPAAPTWRVATRVIAAALLAGVSTRTPLAQQPAAGAGGPVHAAATREGRRGSEADIQVRLLSRRPQMAPAKDRPVLAPGANIVDRNAIGVPVLRHDQAPTASLVRHVAVRPLSAQSAGGGLPVRSGDLAPLHGMAAPSSVSSRNTISGASFARSGAALVPLGGPAKPAATGINGTNIRPKH
jgi:hypothetical protein